MSLLPFQDVFGKLKHVARHLDRRDFIEIGILVADLGLVAERRCLNALTARLEHQEPLTPVHHHTAEANHLGFLHRLADDRERLIGGFAVGHDVKRFIEIDLVDLVARDERFDLERVCRLQRHFVEFVFFEQDILAVVEFVALHLVFGVDDVAGFGIDRLIANSVAGFPVDDVQAYPARRARCGVHGDRARDERQLEVSLPGRARCHGLRTRRDRARNAMNGNAPAAGRVPAAMPDQRLSRNGGATTIKPDLRFRVPLV